MMLYHRGWRESFCTGGSCYVGFVKPSGDSSFASKPVLCWGVLCLEINQLSALSAERELARSPVTAVVQQRWCVQEVSRVVWSSNATFLSAGPLQEHQRCPPPAATEDCNYRSGRFPAIPFALTQSGGKTEHIKKRSC